MCFPPNGKGLNFFRLGSSLSFTFNSFCLSVRPSVCLCGCLSACFAFFFLPLCIYKREKRVSVSLSHTHTHTYIFPLNLQIPKSFRYFCQNGAYSKSLFVPVVRNRSKEKWRRLKRQKKLRKFLSKTNSVIMKVK